MKAPSATRPSRAAWAGALVLLVLALPALAQVPAPQVAIALESASLSLGASNTTLVNATVTYTDTVPTAQASVTLAVEAPDGWTIVIEPSPEFPMNAGSSQTVTLNITAPAALAGALAGDATLTATATSGPGRAPGTASATLALTRVDPPPPPPTDYTPLVIGLVLAALVAGAGGAAYARQRRLAREAAAREAAERAAAERAAYLARETGISIAANGEPLPFGDRREVAVRLTVKNTSERDRVALVEVKESPKGWLAAVNVPRRELQAGEDMVVTLTARPPDGAPLGAFARVVVAARPEEAQELDERVTLAITAPDARPPPNGSHPSVVPRDGVVPKILRR